MEKLLFTRKTESRHYEGSESRELENKTSTAVASHVTQDSSSPSIGSCWQDAETCCILPGLTWCSQAHCRLSDSCEYQWQMPRSWGLEHYFCIYINIPPVSLKHIKKEECLNIVFASWQEGQGHIGSEVVLHEEKRYCWKFVAFIVTWNLSSFRIQRNWKQNPRESVCLAVMPGSWQNKPMWHHAWLVVCQIWQPCRQKKAETARKQECCQPRMFTCKVVSKGLGKSRNSLGLVKEWGSSIGVQLGTSIPGCLKAERVGSIFSCPKENAKFFK